MEGESGWKRSIRERKEEKEEKKAGLTKDSTGAAEADSVWFPKCYTAARSIQPLDVLN